MSNRTHLVLKSALERIQKQNPKFSIRALALKVGVSHVFMMKLLKGSTSVPDEKIPKLIRALDLDDVSQIELRDAVVYDAIRGKLDAFPGLKEKKKLVSETYEEYPRKYFTILDHWYDLVILDLLTCELADYSPRAIAKSLGLTSQEVESSLEKSSKLGLATFEDGYWKKTQNKIRFPTTGANDVTRSYYLQILQKIREELHRSSPEHFGRRSITNLTIAVNPERLPEAKKRLQQTMYDIAEELSQDGPREVFQLLTCLIPVSDR